MAQRGIVAHESHNFISRDSLVTLRPDVIVVSGTQAARAAKQATSVIPIVLAVSAYPERVGLVESLSRPGGNVTGLTNMGP
jgi:putative tryptophan/tyrosine transport system substrate-binding protein